MKNCFIHASWQQLILVSLCTVLLLYSVRATDSVPDYEDGNMEYIVRRQLQPERDCLMCVTTFDLESCVRCRNGQRYSIPFYTAKREFSMARSQPASSNMCGCCAITRLSNNYCCDVCNASKRGG